MPLKLYAHFISLMINEQKLEFKYVILLINLPVNGDDVLTVKANINYMDIYVAVKC